ncbi:MAG TPA: VOC family protein [Gaiellaceae bacterium]|nr:VOC family protein [Gaiellaceae bacterium]
MIVERTDFISVPVTDMERATRFYEKQLGLPRVSSAGNWPEYQLGENISVYLIDLTKVGSSFSGPHTAHVALRVPDVAEARSELEAKGVTFDGDIFDSSVCHMAFFKDPDGNQFMLHRRYAPRES